MNLFLRLATSSILGLDLAAILLAAILAVPAAYADELPPEDEEQGDGGTTTIVVNCYVDCHCDDEDAANDEGCFVLTQSQCRTKCHCAIVTGGGSCQAGAPTVIP